MPRSRTTTPRGSRGAGRRLGGLPGPHGQTKEQIKNYVETAFGYDLDTTLDEIRPRYEFQVSCQKSVPQAIRAFLESDDFEDAVRKAISLGGDSDTLACMAGGIAQAFYGGVPEVISHSSLRVTRRSVGSSYSRIHGAIRMYMKLSPHSESAAQSLSVTSMAAAVFDALL